MPTKNNRHRSTILKAWVLEFASLHGIPLRRTPQANSLAAAFAPTQRQGSLEGPQGWTLRAHAQRGRLDLATALAQLERDRVDNGDPFGATFVQFRSPNGAEDGECAPYVLMSPESWVRIVHALDGTTDPLDSD